MSIIEDLRPDMGEGSWKEHLEVLDNGIARIKKHGSMNVDAMVVTDENHLKTSSDPRSLSQLINIASMPGVIGNAWAMADWHYGYGFPIGGVLATDVEWGEQGGAISPGGVGFDINCGVRLLSIDIEPPKGDERKEWARKIFNAIPAGASSKGGVEITDTQLSSILSGGAAAAIDLGLGEDRDLNSIESNGLSGSLPGSLSGVSYSDLSRATYRAYVSFPF